MAMETLFLSTTLVSISPQHNSLQFTEKRGLWHTGQSSIMVFR